MRLASGCWVSVVMGHDYTPRLNTCQHFDDDNAGMHPSASRLFDALMLTQRAIAPLEPGRVATLMGESPATITNWKTRGVSKAGALKAGEVHGINPSWVTTGEGRMLLSVTSIPNMGEVETPTTDVLLVGLHKRVPVLSWHEVQGFVQGMFTPPEDRYEVVASDAVTPRSFLIEVNGDAMVSAVPEDHIPPGSMLLCDANAAPESGCVVIALHPRSGEPLVRKLVKEGGMWFLRSNNGYPMIEIDDPAISVAAVAIEVTTRRKLSPGGTS